jgi:CRP-like cAMP-binding protein
MNRIANVCYAFMFELNQVKSTRGSNLTSHKFNGGNCMYVIQEGLAEIVNELDQGEAMLALHGKGESFGG